MQQSIPVFCGKDCGGNACPLLADVADGRVQRVSNNPLGGRYLKGCRRGFQLAQEQYAPDRILNPWVRVGKRGSGQFREAGWDEALSITAHALGEVRAKFGAQSVLNWGSAGVTGALHATSGLLSRFLNLFGGCTALTNNYSNGAARIILPYLLGKDWAASGFDAATMQYAEMIILWGANILETRMGTEIPQRLVEAKKRGAQIVVIDPRRSATVQHTATWWIPCRPGTDAALMLAVLNVMFNEQLVDRPFIQAHSSGFDRLEEYVLNQNGGCKPEWAEGICGVGKEEIVRFARAYAAARPAMLLPGYSIQRVFAGQETYRLTVALQIATGNFGRRGGSTGSLNNRLPTPQVGSLPVPPAAAGPGVPVLRWPDAILQGKAGGYPTDIHAVYFAGANPLNQGGDVHKNLSALEKVDFSVCHELFMTPTARSCDVVLPAAGPLEKEDIGIPWSGNYLLYKPQAVQPMGQARSDYDIFCDLADRLGFSTEFSEGRSAAGWVQHFIDQSEIPDPEEFRQTGIYLAAEQERVGLADFSADPLHFPLTTPSGRVEIACESYASEMGGTLIPAWQTPPEDARYPLRLISPKSPHRTHSQGGRAALARDTAGHALEMHPQDAAARGIAGGDLVRLFNDRGASLVTLRLSDDLVQGVVCLPEGVWFELDDLGLDRAGSANLFTSTEGTAPGTACIMHAVAVQVEKISS